jgi:methylphosphotriester-DNA--protein-cysteine methyltransferase
MQHLAHTFVPITATNPIAAKVVFYSGQLSAIQNWEEKTRLSQFSARSLAKSCGVSLRHMERCFKPAVGMSPQEWLNRLRMEHATMLLNKMGVRTTYFESLRHRTLQLVKRFKWKVDSK